MPEFEPFMVIGNKDGPTVNEELRAIDDILQQHERLLRHYGPGDTLAERLKQVITHYQNGATRTVANVDQFRQDLLIQFRAFGLVVDMAGNASTHSEKNARLRGLAEMIATSVQQLREFKLDNFEVSLWSFPDLFRTDFPTRSYVQRIHTLEDEITTLRQQLATATDQDTSKE